MTPATLAAAEAAMATLAAALRGVPAVSAIGIAVLEGGFGVKVNLKYRVDDGIIPDDVDGVPVIVDVVGSIQSL